MSFASTSSSSSSSNTSDSSISPEDKAAQRRSWYRRIVGGKRVVKSNRINSNKVAQQKHDVEKFSYVVAPETNDEDDHHSEVENGEPGDEGAGIIGNFTVTGTRRNKRRHMRIPVVAKHRNFKRSPSSFLDQSELQRRRLSSINRVNFGTTIHKGDKVGVATNQERFRISNYPLLRSPDEFGKTGARLAWAFPKLSHKRSRKRALLMNKHQTQNIRCSLLRLDPRMSNVARRMNNAILGFCGDKSMSFPSTLAQDVLIKALDLPELVDELYLQICKQLTLNPSPTSTARAWHLMCLAASTLPPSRSFEYYLLNFLGNQLQSPDLATQLHADYVLRRLEGMMNSGASGFVPTIEEIQAYRYRPPTLAEIQMIDGSVLASELPVAPDLDMGDLLDMCAHFIQLPEALAPRFALSLVEPVDSNISDRVSQPNKLKSARQIGSLRKVKSSISSSTASKEIVESSLPPPQHSRSVIEPSVHLDSNLGQWDGPSSPSSSSNLNKSFDRDESQEKEAGKGGYEMEKKADASPKMIAGQSRAFWGSWQNKAWSDFGKGKKGHKNNISLASISLSQDDQSLPEFGDTSISGSLSSARSLARTLANMTKNIKHSKQDADDNASSTSSSISQDDQALPLPESIETGAPRSPRSLVRTLPHMRKKNKKKNKSHTSMASISIPNDDDDDDQVSPLPESCEIGTPNLTKKKKQEQKKNGTYGSRRMRSALRALVRTNEPNKASAAGALRHHVTISLDSSLADGSLDSASETEADDDGLGASRVGSVSIGSVNGYIGHSGRSHGYIGHSRYFEGGHGSIYGRSGKNVNQPLTIPRERLKFLRMDEHLGDEVLRQMKADGPFLNERNKQVLISTRSDASVGVGSRKTHKEVEGKIDQQKLSAPQEDRYLDVQVQDSPEPQVLGGQQHQPRISPLDHQSTHNTDSNGLAAKEGKRSAWESVRMHVKHPGSLVLSRSRRQYKTSRQHHRIHRHVSRESVAMSHGEIAESDDWLNRDSSPVPTLVLRCKVYIENEWPCADAFLNKQFYLQVEDNVIYGHTLFSTSTNSAELVVLNAISVLLHFVLDGKVNLETKKSLVSVGDKHIIKIIDEMSGPEEQKTEKTSGSQDSMSVEGVERVAREFFASAHGARNALDLAPWSLISQIPRLQGRAGFFDRVIKAAQSTLSEHIDNVRRDSEFVFQQGLEAGQQHIQDDEVLVDTLRSSLQNMYIERVSRLADVLFGCFDYFSARAPTLDGYGFPLFVSNMPDEVMVCVNARGIHFVDPANRSVDGLWLSLSFDALSSWGSSVHQLYLRVDQDVNERGEGAKAFTVRCLCDDAKTVSRLLTDHAEALLASGEGVKV